MKKINTQSLTQASILLAICIASQFFKNLSVYITGPIINACLILAVFTCGLSYAIMISVITPVTSFLITGSPIMAAIPLIIPCVMLGNVIMVLFVSLLKQKPNTRLGQPISMIAGSLAKSLFMGTAISLILIPMLLPEKMAAMKTVFQTTFSITQLITALTGSVFAYIILIPLKKVITVKK